MHLINNVDKIDFQFVARRYATPFWRTYDLVMLWLVLIHGLAGIRILVADYVRSKGWQVATMASLYVFGFVLLALGSLTILSFQP